MLGNLRSFSQQTFRCTSCGEKFRRVPLSGKCLKCGKDTLAMTVHHGGIVKYLDKSLELSKKFDLGSYMTQRLELIGQYINSLTNNPKVKQRTLSSFF